MKITFEIKERKTNPGVKEYQATFENENLIASSQWLETPWQAIQDICEDIGAYEEDKEPVI